MMIRRWNWSWSWSGCEGRNGAGSRRRIRDRCDERDVKGGDVLGDEVIVLASQPAIKRSVSSLQAKEEKNSRAGDDRQRA